MSDPLIDASSEAIGGPLGKHARTGEPYRTWWLPVRVLLALAFIASSIAFLSVQHCRSADWQSPDMYVHACYSDVAVIYTSRGLDEHRNPFATHKDDKPLAYPVLTNVMIAATSWLVPSGTAPERRRVYFDINALLAVLFMTITLLATARLADPWRDAILVAIAPAGILALFIGWDALAAMLTMIGLVFFKRGSPWLAGIVIGLAISTAFYPLVLIAAFYLVAWTKRSFRDIDRVIIAALATWGVIDLVVALFFFDGVTAFYRGLLEQGPSYGSFWLAMSLLFGISVSALNIWWILTFALGLFGVAVLLKRGGYQPTIAQAGLIVGSLYFLTAKSFAPQQLLWLIPLAALAGLRWRDLVIWQSIEVIYHVALWQYIALVTDAKRGLDADAYGWITMLHLAGLIYLMWRTWQQVSATRPDLPDAPHLRQESQESHLPAQQ